MVDVLPGPNVDEFGMSEQLLPAWGVVWCPAVAAGWIF